MKIPALLKQRELVLWFLLNDVARRFFSEVDTQMRALGLTRAQWYLLTHAYYFDGLTQQELADKMDLTKSSAAKLIRKLEAKGWVERRDDDRDGRLQRVHLVDSLRPTVQLLAKVAKLTLSGFLLHLEEEESSELTRLLRKLEVSLQTSSNAKDKRLVKLGEEVAVIIREMKHMNVFMKPIARRD